MKRFTALVLILLTAGPLWAGPKLLIPPEVKPVDGYVRVGPDTDCVSIMYISEDGLLPFPSEELKDPKRLLIPVTGVKPGRYRFVAVGASAKGEQVRVDFVVVVGDPILPEPPGPVPLPDGKFGLVKVSRDGLSRVTPLAGDRDKLAKAQRALASAVAAGGLTTPFSILNAWREGNNAAVTATVWAPWGTQVGTALNKLFTDGKLKDKGDWAAAFEEIALGLEGK